MYLYLYNVISKTTMVACFLGHPVEQKLGHKLETNVLINDNVYDRLK
jgi:hypothetical protein